MSNQVTFKISTFWQKCLIIFLVSGIATFFASQTSYVKSLKLNHFLEHASPLPSSSGDSLNINTTALDVGSSPTTANPIVSCGPGVHSGQYIKDKQSVCKNYVDCGLNNNTTWTLMLNDTCNKKHSAETTNTPQSKLNVPLSSSHNFTISCTTKYGVYTEYGSTLAEANKYCDDLKAQAQQLSDSYSSIYTSSPTPAQSNSTNVPTSTIRDSNDSVCAQIRQEWNDKKAQIGPLDSTNQNYSSSSDMMADYYNSKSFYQQKYSQAGCSGNIPN